MSSINKKHIIDEIIRTAKENNGIPLGQISFQKITGIKTYDWKEKFWTNWGNALEEAGFERNELTKAYGKEVLIKHIISLIRNSKTFPTSTEISLKHNNSTDFPAFSTFRDGLGRKHEMVEKIINYCKDKPGYDDIIEICKRIKKPVKKEDNFDSDKNSIKFGYVYLMKSGRYYKICKSDCVEKRNYEIGIKLPEELKIIHKIKTDDPFGIEAYWHNRFKDKRKNGEWFELSQSDVKTFKRRKTFM